VVQAAPRIDERLVASLRLLDTESRSIADIHRRLGGLADGLGLARPSYEQVRTLVHWLRAQEPATDALDVLLNVAFRVSPPTALLALLGDE
jgi:hypothetical protein